jgi:hypothetical protein
MFFFSQQAFADADTLQSDPGQIAMDGGSGTPPPRTCREKCEALCAEWECVDECHFQFCDDTGLIPYRTSGIVLMPRD